MSRPRSKLKPRHLEQITDPQEHELAKLEVRLAQRQARGELVAAALRERDEAESARGSSASPR